MRTFVFSDGKSNKFWNIDLSGDTFTVTFGKVGVKGQTQTKGFAGANEARAAHDKLVNEKLKKGYVETTSAIAAPAARAVPPLQAQLEGALAATPDEATAFAAYGDYLAEEGDPRGEFVQVQLALEEAGRSAAERKRLQKREAELLAAHGKEWLGDLGRFLVGDWSGEDKPYHYAFRRGWLDFVRVLPFPDAVIASLARSPEARLLRTLEVVYDMRYHPFDFDQFVSGPARALAGDEKGDDFDIEDIDTYSPCDILPPVLASLYLTNLRVFKLGFSDAGEPAHSTMVGPFDQPPAEQMVELLTKCPRLEELYLNTDLPGIEALLASPALGSLRVLQYYYGVGRYERNPSDRRAPYPLSVLANNPAVRNLTTLRFHPGRDATIDLDELDALLISPHLPKLEHLQVHMTTFGDDVCPRLIASGIMKRLKTLDIGYGNLTDDGARQLAACPDTKKLDVLNVSRNALTAAGVAALAKAGVRVVADDQHVADDTDYLYEVDRE